MVQALKLMSHGSGSQHISSHPHYHLPFCDATRNVCSPLRGKIAQAPAACDECSQLVQRGTTCRTAAFGDVYRGLRPKEC